MSSNCSRMSSKTDLAVGQAARVTRAESECCAETRVQHHTAPHTEYQRTRTVCHTIFSLFPTDSRTALFSHRVLAVQAHSSFLAAGARHERGCDEQARMGANSRTSIPVREKASGRACLPILAYQFLVVALLLIPPLSPLSSSVFACFFFARCTARRHYHYQRPCLHSSSGSSLWPCFSRLAST